MVYKFIYKSKANDYNSKICIVNTISKEYLVYKSSMYNKVIDDKVKYLSHYLPNTDPIEMRTQKDLEKLVKGLDSDEEFTRI